jgi:hypothetical protein
MALASDQNLRTFHLPIYGIFPMPASAATRRLHLTGRHGAALAPWPRHWRQEDSMDDQTFDRLARRFESLTSRRSTLGALAGAGLLSALGGSGLETAAKRKKKKKKCKAESAASTCAGRCGSVKNNCKKAVECGDCGICRRCSGAGVCAADPGQVGDECASDKVCLANGSCQACGASGEPCCPPTSCDGGAVCVSGTCEPCGFLDAPCCSSNNCIPSPGLGCFNGTCELCGDDGEQCCPNSICEVGRVCRGAGRGTCLECGDVGQPCCTTGIDCTFGSECIEGTCVET